MKTAPRAVQTLVPARGGGVLKHHEALAIGCDVVTPLVGFVKLHLRRAGAKRRAGFDIHGHQLRSFAIKQFAPVPISARERAAVVRDFPLADLRGLAWTPPLKYDTNPSREVI